MMPAVRPSIILATPFRPFFLAAGAHATVWIPLWVAVLEGRELATNLGPIGWHAHEMLFGYTGAVFAGFLLTAARAWTGRPTLSGLPLLGLLMLWAAGRAFALHAARLPPWLPLAADGLFWLGVAAATARAVVPARSTRNLSFPALLLVLGAADLVLHLHVTGAVGARWSARAVPVAFDAIALFILIFGGRIIPLFTGNAIAEVSPRPKGVADWIGLGLVALLLVLHSTLRPGTVVHVVAIAAGLVNAARLWGWGGSRTGRSPILWVLHLGWLLLCAAITLLGVTGLTAAVPTFVATHLYTIGGLGVITLGMMARVSLGHTGRPLCAPTSVAIAFGTLVAAAAVRVGLPWIDPDLYPDALRLSGGLWALAFAIFTLRYAPILLSPRADGKPG
jgi:uncharacterized protein involved in response to NO